MPLLPVLGRDAHRVEDGGDLVIAEAPASEFGHFNDVLQLSAMT